MQIHWHLHGLIWCALIKLFIWYKLMFNSQLHTCKGLNSDLKTAAVMVKLRFDFDCLSPGDFKVQLETKTVIRVYSKTITGNSGSCKGFSCWMEEYRNLNRISRNINKHQSNMKDMGPPTADTRRLHKHICARLLLWKVKLPAREQVSFIFTQHGLLRVSDSRQINRCVRNSFYFYINKAQFSKHLEKTSALYQWDWLCSSGR